MERGSGGVDSPVSGGGGGGGGRERLGSTLCPPPPRLPKFSRDIKDPTLTYGGIVSTVGRRGGRCLDNHPTEVKGPGFLAHSLPQG